MINAEDDIFIKFETSCTEKEAAAKMLGWLQGPIYKSVIHVTEYGISADQMPHLSQLEDSLEDHLLELRNAARAMLFKALEEDAPSDVISEKENAVIEWDELIGRAATYLQEIVDEVAKGDASALRIDHEATTESGITHITLKSLKVWALEEYGISIDPFSAQKTTVNVPQLQQKSPAEEIQQIDDQSSQEEGWSSPIKAETVYTTLAFLVEAFAQTSTDFLKDDGTPNVSAIAKHLQEHAQKANRDCDLLGQKDNNIRKIIGKSIGIKMLTLRKRGEGK